MGLAPKFCRAFRVLQNLSSTGFLLCATFAEPSCRTPKVPQNSGEPLGARSRLLRTGFFSSQIVPSTTKPCKSDFAIKSRQPLQSFAMVHSVSEAEEVQGVPKSWIPGFSQCRFGNLWLRNSVPRSSKSLAVRNSSPLSSEPSVSGIPEDCLNSGLSLPSRTPCLRFSYLPNFQRRPNFRYPLLTPSKVFDKCFRWAPASAK